MSKDDEKKLYVFQIETKDFGISVDNLANIQHIIEKALKENIRVYVPGHINISVIRKSMGFLKRVKTDPKLQDKYKSYIQLLDNISAVRVKEFTMHLDPSVKEEPDYENLIDITKAMVKEASKELGIKVELVGEKESYEVEIENVRTRNSMDAKSVYNAAYAMQLVSGVIHDKAVSLRKEFEGIVIPKDMETINSCLESEGLQGCAKDPNQLRSILKLIAIKEFVMKNMYEGGWM